VISGIGRSPIGRRLGRSGLDLTLEACLAAIADAGLTPRDVDGLSNYPGGTAANRDFAGPGAAEILEALRLEVGWYLASGEGPSQLQSFVNAALAVSAGLATHVLVYRGTTESSARVTKGAPLPTTRPGPSEWQLPFGATSAAHWTAMIARSHFDRYGTTREQLAQIALTERANAVDNPHAVYRDALTMDDYLAARMVSTPLCLYDCDVPVDGAYAFVVSSVDRAADLPNVPIHLNAVGTAIRGRPLWDQWRDLAAMAATDAGSHLWTRTDLRPADVDVAQLYDGFSIYSMLWLEALGFCPPGESGPFVEGGTRIARTGELPINTGGGQLSGGRVHGTGHIHEACLQLRGEAGAHQLRRQPEVAVVAGRGDPPDPGRRVPGLSTGRTVPRSSDQRRR
jgi:acetyl-CoA acetyltransferase